MSEFESNRTDSRAGIERNQTRAVTLAEGDCLDVVAAMPADSVDAIVTDPPYHLASIVKRFGGQGAAPAKEGTDGLFRRASKGFMGKEWDGGDIAFRPETWATFLRVAKPGAHLVAFNHSRTWHHMATAIEAAGWEIRDTLMWLYGSGMPKSHDVAAGIDKLRDDHADIVKVTAWVAASREAAGLSNAAIDAAFGTNGMAGHWTTRGAQAAIPRPEQWARLVEILRASPPAEISDLVATLNARKGQPGENWENREVIGEATYSRSESGSWAEHVDGGMFKAGERSHQITRATPEAAEWEGWGTALKPAFEPIVLARKPLAAGSVARQTLATGTGGLNLGACRVGSEVRHAAFTSLAPCAGNRLGDADTRDARRGTQGEKKQYVGRFPANVLHDGSAEVLGRFPVDTDGSAARFFYCGKAGPADRAGSKHPTVKPQALMRWLVRLVTPRRGLVLDPFGGSGATGWAAATEGRRAHLIERDPDYAAHIRARLPEFDPDALAATPASAEAADDDPQPSLF